MIGDPDETLAGGGRGSAVRSNVAVLVKAALL